MTRREWLAERLRTQGLETFWWDTIRSCPEVADLVREATLRTDVLPGRQAGRGQPGLVHVGDPADRPRLGGGRRFGRLRRSDSLVRRDAGAAERTPRGVHVQHRAPASRAVGPVALGRLRRLHQGRSGVVSHPRAILLREQPRRRVLVVGGAAAREPDGTLGPGQHAGVHDGHGGFFPVLRAISPEVVGWLIEHLSDNGPDLAGRVPATPGVPDARRCRGARWTCWCLSGWTCAPSRPRRRGHRAQLKSFYDLVPAEGRAGAPHGGRAVQHSAGDGANRRCDSPPRDA